MYTKSMIRSRFTKHLLFWFVLALCQYHYVFAVSETPVVPPENSLISNEAGPCVIGPDGKLVCSIDANSFSSPTPSDQKLKSSIDVENQPWLVESSNLPPNSPSIRRDHMIWADSFMWTALEDIMPAIPVEKWLTRAPSEEDLRGKYVLVEVWATWCPPCRRSLPYLDFIAKKYKDDLVVVSICEMDENAIRNMPGKGLNIFEVGYFVAVDTGRRWEGMPTLPGYELSDKKLERFFDILQKLRDAGRLPEKSPITFEVSEPTPQERASRKRTSSSADDTADKQGLPSL